MHGKAADDPHRRRQDSGDSGLDVASFDHADIAAEPNKKLKFKVLVSHSSGSVAAMEGPKDVTKYMVRFVCDMLETWGFGVCILKCQNEPAEIALQNAVVRTRQVKTIPTNTPKYSHGSLGHCESAIKEVEKQIRAMLFRTYAGYNCNSEKFPAELQNFSSLVRHAAWTLTRHAIKADGQTSCFKLMSKDHHGEIAKFSELVWFRIPAKQPKLAEQWKAAHWVGKSERSDEHLLAIRVSTYSARPIRRKPREEQWNLDSVKAVLVRPWELRVRTEFDAPAVGQKYITNQALDKHGRTPLSTRCALGTGAHSSECRARFEAIWTKELAETDVASCADDSIHVSPDVKECESLESTEAVGQPVEMEGVSTDQVIERAGGASPQLDEERAQPMDVSLDQSATTGATKRRAETQLTPNSAEGYIGGLRSFDGHQVEQAQWTQSLMTVDGMITISESCSTVTSTSQDERKN